MSSAGELSKKFARLTLISCGCFFLRSKPSKLVPLSMAHNFCAPATAPLFKVNTLNASLGYCGMAVGVVHRSGADTKIAAPIIKAVSVSVINIIRQCGTRYEAVHINELGQLSLCAARIAARVNGFSRWVQMPFVTEYQCFVGIVKKHKQVFNRDLSHAQSVANPTIGATGIYV